MAYQKFLVAPEGMGGIGPRPIPYYHNKKKERESYFAREVWDEYPPYPPKVLQGFVLVEKIPLTHTPSNQKLQILCLSGPNRGIDTTIHELGELALPWSVAQTHPNAAAIACANLKRQGFSFYNPLIKERVKLKHGFTWRTAQMFSNYLFVEIVDQWRAVKSTIGISHVLMSESEKPGVMKDEFILGLKAKENSEGFIILGQSKFKQESKVQVKAGPFAYMTGKFDGLSSHDRVYVLLSMLGTERRIEMREDNLIAV